VLEGSGEPAQTAAISEALERLVASGSIDRVLRAPDPGLSGSSARYVRDVPEALPLPPRTAAELWGVAEASSDHVLLTSARMFFYSAGSNWIADALARLRADDRLWLMTTHAGPPSGAIGSVRSLSREEMGPLSWDRRLGVWRSRRALSEYFLLDRRKIAGALSPQDPAPACLGDWITTAMAKAGGSRGSLDGRRSWAVHARGELALSDWPLRFTRLIEKGLFPTCQRGRFHLDLQNERLERAWRQLAENVPLVSSANA
jgi:hypothetical protein